MNKRVIQKDFDSCQHLPPEQALRYKLMCQLTRLTADRGALTNDDRLDAPAMACQYWVDAMAQDAEVRMGASRDELMVAELDRLKAAASLGLAVITGHQGQETNSLRW
jgi:inactivated superfamily I helicase